MTALLWQRPLAAAPVPVRIPEGSLHRFLVLSTPEEVSIASGDLLLVERDGEVKSRLEFHFKDGSVFDETVVFTQRDVFTMQSYHRVQRGPVFPEDTEVSLERASGKYHVKIRNHKDGQAKVLDGTIDLPLDAYNGMVPTVLKNLSGRARETIHMVVFTPAPKLIKLELVPAGEVRMSVGGSEKSAIHYVLKPVLGIWLKFFASLLGRMPPDNHVWIVTTDVPVFVKFEGQLYMNGPVWRIELTSPRWPDIGGFVPGRLWKSLKSHQCRDHSPSTQYLKALLRFGMPHGLQTPRKQPPISGWKMGVVEPLLARENPCYIS